MIPRENPRELPSNLLKKVFKNLSVFKKQEQVAQFIVRRIN